MMQQKKHKCEIVKDILAMANTKDGGKIIFGVRDSDFETVGLDQSSFNSFDPTKVNDFLKNYTDPRFTVSVTKQVVEQKNIVVIEIPEYKEIPIICKKQYPQILKKGEIYIRTGEPCSKTIQTSEDMRNFLGRAITKKSDQLLKNIKNIITGKPKDISKENKIKYEEEIDEAKEFLKNEIGNKIEHTGYFEIVVEPNNYNESKIENNSILKNHFEESIVNISGWSFPYIHNLPASGSNTNFDRGFQSFTDISGTDVEGFRIYKSGLYIMYKAFLDDLRMGEATSYISAAEIIVNLTELFLFIKRFYGNFMEQEDLSIKIILHNCLDRDLDLGQGFSRYDYKCHQDNPKIKNTYKVINIKADYIEEARKLIEQIFFIFNFENSRSYIKDLQNSLFDN